MKVKTLFKSIYQLVSLISTKGESNEAVADQKSSDSEKIILNFGMAISLITPMSWNSLTY